MRPWAIQLLHPVPCPAPEFPQSQGSRTCFPEPSPATGSGQCSLLRSHRQGCASRGLRVAKVGVGGRGAHELCLSAATSSLSPSPAAPKPEPTYLHHGILSSADTLPLETLHLLKVSLSYVEALESPAGLRLPGQPGSVFPPEDVVNPTLRPAWALSGCSCPRLPGRNLAKYCPSLKFRTDRLGEKGVPLVQRGSEGSLGPCVRTGAERHPGPPGLSQLCSFTSYWPSHAPERPQSTDSLGIRSSTEQPLKARWLPGPANSYLSLHLTIKLPWTTAECSLLPKPALYFLTTGVWG